LKTRVVWYGGERVAGAVDVLPDAVLGGGGLHGAGEVGAEDKGEVVCDHKTFVAAIGVVGEELSCGYFYEDFALSRGWNLSSPCR